MVTKIKVLVGQGRKALLVSAGLSLGLFAFATRSVSFDSTLFSRHLLVSTLIFVFTFLSLRLFAHVVAQHLGKEVAALDGVEVSARSLWIFVVYKELVKCAVGVSLTLAWIAGLLFFTEKFAASFLMLTGAGVAYSGALYLFTYVFVLFVDQIPYPFSR